MGTDKFSFDDEQLEYGVYRIPIQLEVAFDSRRQFFEQTLVTAQRRLREFAIAHQWRELVRDPFAVQARFYGDKALFDRDIRERCGIGPTAAIPPTFCAALENNILMSVTPELYRSVFPEGEEKDAFEKLLTHEMAHRLHIRILGGNEDAMGPVWFFEGFALHAAGQLEEAAPRLTTGEIWSVVQAEQRMDYRRYVTVFRHFLLRHSLERLIEMAGTPNFSEWLMDASGQ